MHVHHVDTRTTKTIFNIYRAQAALRLSDCQAVALIEITGRYSHRGEGSPAANSNELDMAKNRLAVILTPPEEPSGEMSSTIIVLVVSISCVVVLLLGGVLYCCCFRIQRDKVLLDYSTSDAEDHYKTHLSFHDGGEAEDHWAGTAKGITVGSGGIITP